MNFQIADSLSRRSVTEFGFGNGAATILNFETNNGLYDESSVGRQPWAEGGDAMVRNSGHSHPVNRTRSLKWQDNGLLYPVSLAGSLTANPHQPPIGFALTKLRVSRLNDYIYLYKRPGCFARIMSCLNATGTSRPRNYCPCLKVMNNQEVYISCLNNAEKCHAIPLWEDRTQSTGLWRT